MNIDINQSCAFSEQEIKHICNALDIYESFSKGERKVFKILITLFENGIIKINVPTLAKRLELTPARIHGILKYLSINEYIKKINEIPFQRNADYVFNIEKLNFIIQEYEKKQKLIELTGIKNN